MPKPISSGQPQQPASPSPGAQGQTPRGRVEQVFAQKPLLPTEPLKPLQNRKITYLKGIGLGLLGIIGTVGGVALIAISGGTALLVAGGTAALIGGAVATYKSGKQLEMARKDAEAAERKTQQDLKNAAERKTQQDLKNQEQCQTVKGFCKVNTNILCEKTIFAVDSKKTSLEQVKQEIVKDITRGMIISCNGKEYPNSKEQGQIRLDPSQDVIAKQVVDRLLTELGKKYSEQQLIQILQLSYQAGFSVMLNPLVFRVTNQNDLYHTNYSVTEAQILPGEQIITIDTSKQDPVVHFKSSNSFCISDPSNNQNMGANQLFGLKEGSIRIGNDQMTATVEYEYKSSIKQAAQDLFSKEGEKFFSTPRLRNALLGSVTLSTESSLPLDSPTGSVSFEGKVYTSLDQLRDALEKKGWEKPQLDAVINSCQMIKANSETTDKDLKKALQDNYHALNKKLGITEEGMYEFHTAPEIGWRSGAPPLTKIKVGNDGQVLVTREERKYFLAEKKHPHKGVTPLIQASQEYRILKTGLECALYQFDVVEA